MYKKRQKRPRRQRRDELHSPTGALYASIIREQREKREAERLANLVQLKGYEGLTADAEQGNGTDQHA